MSAGGWDDLDDDISRAIMESLAPAAQVNGQQAEEQDLQLLKEVMKLSQMEYMKDNGALDLNALKRKKPDDTDKDRRVSNKILVQPKPTPEKAKILKE